ncbi:MAG: MobA/MobL family protein, partial [Rhizobiales bacterium]|nr:MobA/MobL family protein [Hyphomicrobiales bacterium]
MQDGNIHCHIGNVSSKNEDPTQRSAVSAASYQSGETIFSTQKNKNITAREGGDDEVVFKEIAAPKGAPEWTHDRAQLWNKVEAHSKRKDQRLAKKIEVALTRDIPVKERLQLLKDFIKPFVALGCVVDMAIHNDAEDHN